MIMACLGAAMVAGGTYALFTDEASVKNNSFAAGTVDLKLGELDQMEQGIIDVSNFAPGDTSLPKAIQIKNAGSLDLFYRIVPANVKLKTPQTDDWVTLFDENGNFLGLPDGMQLDLAKIHINVYDKGGTGQTFDLFGGQYATRTFYLPAREWTIPANHYADLFTTWVTLDKDAGNDLQGLQLKGDLKVQGVQAKNNDKNQDGQPDSWEN